LRRGSSPETTRSKRRVREVDLPGDPIRIIVVDDHRFVRELISAMLARQSGHYRVVAEHGDAMTAIEACRELKPTKNISELLQAFSIEPPEPFAQPRPNMKTRTIIILASVLTAIVGVGAVPHAIAQDSTCPPGSNVWATGAPESIGTNASGIGVINGSIYVAGGPSEASGARNLQIYNPVTNSWSNGAQLPFDLGQQASGVINGKLYLVGGWSNTDENLPTASMEIFDPSTDQWSSGPSASVPRGLSAGAVIGQKLYFAGGNSHRTVTAALEIYDATSNSWSSGSPLPIPTMSSLGAAINGKFYVVGGYTDRFTTVTGAVQIYEPASNSWTSGAPMPAPLADMQGNVVNGQIYVTGGYEQGYAFNQTTYVYDPVANNWSSGPATLVPRADGMSAAIGSTLYLIGGGNATGHLSETDVFFGCPGGPPPVTTPAGSDIVVNVELPNIGTIGASFPQVTAAGYTTVTQIDPASAGALAVGFGPASPSLGFDIATTAAYSPSTITIAFKLPNLDAPTFAQLRVFHREACTDTNPGCVNGFTLVDVTASIPAPDPVSQTIYAQVNSLSPFVIAKRVYRATVQPPINADGSSVFTVKRGVAPVKFALSFGGVATSNLPTAMIAVSRTAGGTVGTVNESTFIMPADSGSFFRIDASQYVYNLNSSALSTGTYRVDIKINGQIAGSAVFKLK